MALYEEILCKMLAQEQMQITFPNIRFDLTTLLESKCYQALCAIKAIIEDMSLCDESCFEKIERIVCLFEDLGSNGGDRHDF